MPGKPGLYTLLVLEWIDAILNSYLQEDSLMG